MEQQVAVLKGLDALHLSAILAAATPRRIPGVGEDARYPTDNSTKCQRNCEEQRKKAVLAFKVDMGSSNSAGAPVSATPSSTLRTQRDNGP
jgi:hypothetical protein